MFLSPKPKKNLRKSSRTRPRIWDPPLVQLPRGAFGPRLARDAHQAHVSGAGAAIVAVGHHGIARGAGVLPHRDDATRLSQGEQETGERGAHGVKSGATKLVGGQKTQNDSE